ncbi:hypothetical protein BDQ12DRAFT_725579 [Crucibulum laeve]|uniref:FAD/NAD(P)-binding domain-containing protein n=1 Tax=Crucibulum laeve TaxID=68775 RepID=A0A5C3LV16_9AGAR|nr:hypothetical protein BDQ12DRAFT_725579 [Crucibulum laeve]
MVSFRSAVVSIVSVALIHSLDVAATRLPPSARAADVIDETTIPALLRKPSANRSLADLEARQSSSGSCDVGYLPCDSATVKAAVLKDVNDYFSESSYLFHTGQLLQLLSPIRLWKCIWDIFYILVQAIIIVLFKPSPPKTDRPSNPCGRIAIIGAGLTGISSAAHVVAHNFDVVIYEAGSRSSLGGIWTHVNRTSGLQLNSLLYRFHPGVLWSRAFPLRDEIVGEIERIWKEYKLDTRTRFETPVTSVYRAPRHESDSDDPDRSRWLINDGSDGEFDAVIVTVGTCGKPQWIGLPGMPSDAGKEQRSKDGEENNSPTQDNAQHDDESSDSGTDDEQEDDKHEEHSEKETHTPDTPPEPDTTLHPLTHKERRKRRHHIQQRAEKKKSSGSKSRKDLDTFKGIIIHSSQLDSPEFQLKGCERVVVIGSGASGVEAVETVLERFGSVADAERLGLWRKEVEKLHQMKDKAEDEIAEEVGRGNEEDKKQKKGVYVSMIARTDKWIIPRNIMVDTFLACQPFGRQMPLSFLWEWFLTHWQYNGVEDLVPKTKGIFEGTPVVNDAFLPHVRSGRCTYVRGEPVRLTKDGVLVKPRKEPSRHVHKRSWRGKEVENNGVKDTEHDEELVEADVIVLATGFEKPKIDFLEVDLFPEGYQRPDLYLQNFSTEDWSILMTNSSYMNAIGTVGHFHIGIYTRILLTLLMDQSARPSPKDMKLWVDVLRFLKRGATGGALGFFTYAELTIWLLGFHLLRPDRLRWLFFIMNGWGVYAKN